MTERERPDQHVCTPECDKRTFLELYMYQCGLGNTPKQWHFWSAISLLAATVGNNVWVNTEGLPLYPNMYVFLVGGSGVGKGAAILPASYLVNDEDAYINKRSIDNMTKQGVMKHLIEVEPAVPTTFIHGSRLWIVTDELGDATPAGPLSMELIKAMTNWYIGKQGKNWDLTRGGGSIHVNDPMLNWLAGSTEDWLFASLDPTAVSGGFFARTFVIYGKKETDHASTSYPEDRERVRLELRARIEIFRRIHSEFVFHPKAWKAYLDWYPNRPKSDDPEKQSIHNRDNAMVWKLSTIACLEEQPMNHTGEYSHIIQARHVERAVMWLREARKDLDVILQQAHRTRETISMDRTLDVIKDHAGGIQRSQLLRKLERLGVKSGDLNAIVMTLGERGEIEEYRATKGATMYRTKKRRAY